MTWQDFLKPDEKARIAEIEAQSKVNVADRRKIFQRCRARLKRYEAGKAER